MASQACIPTRCRSSSFCEPGRAAADISGLLLPCSHYCNAQLERVLRAINRLQVQRVDKGHNGQGVGVSDDGNGRRSRGVSGSASSWRDSLSESSEWLPGAIPVAISMAKSWV